MKCDGSWTFMNLKATGDKFSCLVKNFFMFWLLSWIDFESRFRGEVLYFTTKCGEETARQFCQGEVSRLFV